MNSNYNEIDNQREAERDNIKEPEVREEKEREREIYESNSN